MEDLKTLEPLGIADVLRLLKPYTLKRQYTIAITPGGYFIVWHHPLASPDDTEAGTDWVEEFDCDFQWDLSKDKFGLQSDSIKKFVCKEFLEDREKFGHSVEGIVLGLSASEVC